MEAIPTAERQTLIDLYNSTNGAGWTDNTNWNGAPGTECTWYGITCDSGSSYVEEIELSNNSLIGALPDLSPLTNLNYFDVGENQLNGSIPDLSSLSKLEVVLVWFNDLTGEIPDLSALLNLKTFAAAVNDLTGEIPDLSTLTQLRGFNVGGNQLRGSIPDLSSLVNLNLFQVADNKLTGSIPDISTLTQLQVFNVHRNQLTGTPPAAPPNLLPASSYLCPNFLHTPSPSDAAWDAAVGGTWSIDCTPGYLVTTSAGANGDIDPSHAVVSGQSTTITVTPDAGFEIDSVAGSCGGSLSGQTYTTNAITADCDVTVTFRGVGSGAAATQVPTLNQWMMIILGLLLGLLGVYTLNTKARKR